jgi:hypothetical protein
MNYGELLPAVMAVSAICGSVFGFMMATRPPVWARPAVAVFDDWFVRAVNRCVRALQRPLRAPRLEL